MAGGCRPSINRLKSSGTKRKEREGARPPLADIPVVSCETQLAAAVGDQGVRSLRDNGYTLTGLRIGTMLFSEFLKGLATHYPLGYVQKRKGRRQRLHPYP